MWHIQQPSACILQDSCKQNVFPILVLSSQNVYHFLQLDTLSNAHAPPEFSVDSNYMKSVFFASLHSKQIWTRFVWRSNLSFQITMASVLLISQIWYLWQLKSFALQTLTTKSDATWIAERLLCSFGKMFGSFESAFFSYLFSAGIEELGTGDFFFVQTNNNTNSWDETNLHQRWN